MKGIVVASSNGRAGIEAAIAVLRAGGSALDAVEAGARCVEANLDDDSVGVGGLPNFLGEVELDASVMDGRTLATGAVAALKGFPHPISVARRVMMDLPHVLLVGDGAARFAAHAGFARAELLTEQARDAWQAWLRGVVPAEATPAEATYYAIMQRWTRGDAVPPRPGGTVNFLALDGNGNLASAASSSGWPFSYPGRVGDSPLPGAGQYCDDRYGAAACTGHGELVMRTGAARAVVAALQFGRSLPEALDHAAREIQRLPAPFHGIVRIIALDAGGNHAGVATGDASYIVQDVTMASWREVPHRTVS